ncbi:glucan biosynthesis protein [Skermanella mucosa]|uniref:glucan biosynthesis protein n=1 Tax=Skermanella mucosa TaxID=1789672 RepID=UPI00192CA869|nr:glucan biosynthesis protein [Skermanella mucosa]UEM21423.1 glucan biosynthesis protein [Skermanella mucosa]
MACIVHHRIQSGYMNDEPLRPRPSPGFDRRKFLLATAGAGAAGLLPFGPALAQDAGPQQGTAPGTPAAPAPAFTFETVQGLARDLAERDYSDDQGRVPQPLRDLSYDQYRDIRFKPDQAVWRGDKLFQLQFFHLGFLYQRPVRINLLQEGRANLVEYRPGMFDYGANRFGGDLPADLGFAGFRIHYPLNRPDYADELAVFLGASYFRILGRNQIYGNSARGLAVDTAAPSGEDFPAFREFWIEEPGADATQLTLYALLDSRSATGAYRFVLHPGTDTQADVTASVYPRRDIAKLGVAPLTSMFFFGENRTRTFDDFRPEVHDGDGLQIETGRGEWIWRPLTNPRDLRVSSFSDENPRRFGVVQRDRDFGHYQDLESLYHRRPSYWVEPAGEWGKGRIELVEIPTEEEINDNIAAYWVPERPVRAGEGLDFAYRLRSVLETPGQPPLARVISTRIGSARVPGRPDLPEDGRHFVLEFQGGELEALRPEQPVEAVVTTTAGELRPVIAHRNGETGGWRVFFDLLPDGRPADMRCVLRLRGQAISETWVYLWSPA